MEGKERRRLNTLGLYSQFAPLRTSLLILTLFIYLFLLAGGRGRHSQKLAPSNQIMVIIELAQYLASVFVEKRLKAKKIDIHNTNPEVWPSR